MILTALQAKRALAKEGCSSFLVHVTVQDKEQGATAEASPLHGRTTPAASQICIPISANGTDFAIHMQAALAEYQDVFATALPAGVPQDTGAFETI